MRIDQITFLRFVAALAIVVFHYGGNIFPFNEAQLKTIITRANIGVSFFFILSGFVMIVAYYKSQETRVNPYLYYKNRIARIYPIYIIALTMMIIFYTSTGVTISIMDVILGSLAIQSWFPVHAITLNQPGWSLSVEFLFYCLFPFLINKYYYNYNLSKISVVIISIWAFSQILFNYLLRTDFYQGWPSVSHNILYFFPVMHLSQFLIGNLAGLFFLKHRDKISGNHDLSIILLMVAFLAVMKYPLPINYHNGFLAFLVAPLIILLSVNRGRLTRLFENKRLVFLGEISYGIYILQMPVYLITYKFLHYLGISNELVLFYVTLLFLVFLSAVSYIYVETPLRNRLKKLKFHELSGHLLHKRINFNRH